MPTLGHICFSSRARAAKCWNLGAIFTPKNRSQFKITQTEFWKKIWNFETICNNAPWILFQINSSNWMYLASELVNKRKIWRENYFFQNMCGFCREKILRILVGTASIKVTWFSQYGCFKTKAFWLKVNFSHQTHAVGFVEKKILRTLARMVRTVVTWFSKYSCLKVQNFAIICQLWHALFPD